VEGEPVMDQESLRLDDLLRRVRRSIADLELSRKRIQAHITSLAQEEAKLAAQAAKALQMGREDLAHVALGRQREAEAHRGELAVQLGQVLAEETKLTVAAQRLQTKKAFRQFGLDGQDSEP
jgi:phage shock protein A